MPIIATSPLDDMIIGQYYFVPLGDNSLGYFWSLSPGFYLPPGIQLDPTNGTIFGIPTIPGTYHFLVSEMNLATRTSTQGSYLVKISNSAGVTEARIQSMIELAFQLQKAYPGQKVWFEQSIDPQNRRVLAVMADDNGQVRTLTSITVQ